MIKEGTGAVSCWIAVTFEQSGKGHCGSQKEGGEQEVLKKGGGLALSGRGQSVQNRVRFRPGLGAHTSHPFLNHTLYHKAGVSPHQRQNQHCQALDWYSGTERIVSQCLDCFLCPYYSSKY